MVYKFNLRLMSVMLMTSVLIISGCMMVRKATYPPDFAYLDKQTVTSSMRRLAFSVDNIDRILDEADSTPVAELRNSIISELKKMEEIADTLGAGTKKTNHLFIDQHIDQFKSDVIEARHFIETEPSNYYLAGKLVGSCTSCHILRPDRLILMNVN